jgi:TolB protein
MMIRKELIGWIAGAVGVFFFSGPAFPMLSMELTRGVSSAVPIDVKPFTIEGQTSEQDVSAIVKNDLKNSGRFKVVTTEAGNCLTGMVQETGINRYRVSFQLAEVFKDTGPLRRSVLLNRRYMVSGQELRAVAHHISDAVYQQIMGVRGVFSTRLAYVVVQQTGHNARYVLEVSDQDGYAPRPLLSSSDPIMSPAWSRDGKQIAYVSFENHHAAIYVQDIATGSRHLVSEFNGINGAPAWSPDGRKLAVALSKSGSLNIYVMDLVTRGLVQLTHDDYINTEPNWSPDGRSLIFTSNRSGNPQIYEMNLGSRTVTRVTYDGKYNARASYAPDGKHIVMLNQDSGLFNIGILDLDTGVFRVLTHSEFDSESPGIAPNGSMVLFETLYAGRSILGMVAADGGVQIRLPARNGEVQDPAWSPFLS